MRGINQNVTFVMFLKFKAFELGQEEDQKAKQISKVDVQGEQVHVKIKIVEVVVQSLQKKCEECLVQLSTLRVVRGYYYHFMDASRVPEKLNAPRLTQLVEAKPEAGDQQLCSAVLFPLWKCRLSFKPLSSSL